MDPRKLFADERHAAFCVFCGAEPTTREHAASKALLDDPLPDDLPIVYSCQECNSGFSADEEYLACFLECVISGTTDPDKLSRKKVAAALGHSRGLQARIEASRFVDADSRLGWKPDDVRVRNVVLKLARGHIAHQYSEPQLEDPVSIVFVPFGEMTTEQRNAFESPPQSLGFSTIGGYPEIGSRAFINLFEGGDKTYDPESGWSVLQSGRYRYLVGQFFVRIVLSEYLACEVEW